MTDRQRKSIAATAAIVTKPKLTISLEIRATLDPRYFILVGTDYGQATSKAIYKQEELSIVSVLSEKVGRAVGEWSGSNSSPFFRAGTYVLTLEATK